MIIKKKYQLYKNYGYTVKDFRRELAKAPEMEFRNEESRIEFEELREKNPNFIMFAENWARLMQKKMLFGTILTGNIIEKSYQLADTIMGNSAYSANWTRRALIDYWKFGDKLFKIEEM